MTGMIRIEKLRAANPEDAIEALEKVTFTFPQDPEELIEFFNRLLDVLIAQESP